MQWKGRPYAEPDLKLWRDALATHKIPVFGHAGYLINIAAPACANRELSLQSLIQEIELAESLRLPFLVLHPGAHLGTGEAAGIQQAAAALDTVITATRKAKVRIALENTAGQGTCLGNRIEHLAEIFDRAKYPRRLAVCLDTAHLFAAGYNIRTRNGWESVIAEVDRLLGLNQVLAFHLNDSKTQLGSRIDRHAHIGEGKIGKEGFRHIVNDLRFEHLPACLETPKSADLHEDIRNLATLNRLVRRRKITFR